MNDNFTDRLLDASLKEYSRVSPPEDFAARVLAKRAARRLPLIWLWIPAAAAALACGILMMRPVPLAPAPLRLTAPPLVGQVSLPAVVRRSSKSGGQGCLPHCEAPFHTLTGVELASMTLPAELFAKQEEISEIVIPELTVAPLEIPTIPEPEGVKQQ